MRILIFGDSLAQGLFDSRGGWVSRLQSEANIAAMNNPDLMTQESRILFYNLGVAGDRLEEVHKRFKSEVEARFRTDDRVIIVLATGLNDACLVDNRVVSDEADFENRYGQLIELARDYTDDVLTVGIVAIDESKIGPHKERFGSRTWSNNRINLIEDCIKQISDVLNVSFVPIHDEFYSKLEEGQELLASDGLHPNEHGHKLIYERVRDGLDKLLAA